MVDQSHRQSRNASPLKILQTGGISMDNFKTGLCLCASSATGATAALVAAACFSVAAPVALGIGYAIAGGSIFLASQLDD